MDQRPSIYVYKGIQWMPDIQIGGRTRERRGKIPSIRSRGESALPKSKGPGVLMTLSAAPSLPLGGMGIHP